MLTLFTAAAVLAACACLRQLLNRPERKDAFFWGGRIRLTALWNDGAAFSLPLKRKLVTALSSPAFGVPPEDLARARGRLRTGDFYDCLLSMEDRGQALDSFLSWLSEMRGQSRLLPLGELLELVLQTTGMEDVFSAMEGGAARRENLQLLRAQASAFSASGNQSLMGFLRYLDEL